ncbi:MAG: ferrous iron transport protein A [Candidatus Methanomethyliaceae archaeon]|nr:ferrous iron transport protein A [Candidatus Methanomethyliaceae archaeon]
MLEELLEAFCKLKSKLGTVTREDMKKSGFQEGELDSAITGGYLQEEGGKLKITDRGESLLLNHRERFVHNSIIHQGDESARLDSVDHWISCHKIDRSYIDDFYNRLKAIPCHIEELIPLLELPEGREAEVVFLVGGRGLISRLCSLGITPGTVLKVLRRAPIGGPLELAVRSTKVAIGREVASKILVKPL